MTRNPENQSTAPTPARPPRTSKGTRPRRHHSVVGTLLGIWAHPDDEAYLSAALMRQARDAGHRVVVATATPGEHRTDDPGRWPPARLARVREREMAASLAALDVSEHHWLGHRDGSLEQVDMTRGVAQVTALINEVRPDTIVTFGPDGMTGHPDHQAVSNWVTAAWLTTGRAGRLWYATVTPEFHRAWGNVNRDVGFFYPGTQPPCDPKHTLAHQIHCDHRQLDAKFAALQAHTSQTNTLIDRLGTDVYRQWWSTESFIDATLKPTPARLHPQADAA